MSSIGKYLVVIGILIVILGGILWLFGNKFTWFGNLPGDIKIKKENFSFYFPLATMIVLSILLSLILWLINRFLR